MSLSQCQTIGMRLEQSHSSHSASLMTDLGALSDDDLAELLENSLIDIQLQKSSNSTGGNGNFYNTYDFMSKTSSAAQRARDRGLSGPNYRVDVNGNGLRITGTQTYAKSLEVLKKYKRDEDVPPQRLFGKKLVDTLNFVDTKRTEAIKYVLKNQLEAIDSGDISKLAHITQSDIAENLNLHETTVSRLIRGLSLEYGSRSILLADLIPGTNFDEILGMHHLLEISRERGLTQNEWDLSDQKMVNDLSSRLGKPIARRTINKYRNLLKQSHIRFGVDKPKEDMDYIQHWSYERPIREEEIVQIVRGELDSNDIKSLSCYTQGEDELKLLKYANDISEGDVNSMHPTKLWYTYSRQGSELKPEVKVSLASRINDLAGRYNTLSVQDIEYFMEN